MNGLDKLKISFKIIGLYPKYKIQRWNRVFLSVRLYSSESYPHPFNFRIAVSVLFLHFYIKFILSNEISRQRHSDSIYIFD